ncbi:MAG: SDR family oxidoreductase [Sterolibacterium sp.]|jgi:3-oxoacyl-[acyl-carrier protein] reductase|nr:SDR family oxidoreductase [Sterolibacterium sp.]
MNNTPSSIQRVALVSGGGTGIGRAICLRLARDGLKVVVVWSRSAEGARQTVASIEAAGGTACALRANIAEETDVQSLFAAVQACYGRLDVLINNAGIGHMKSFENISMAAYDQIFSVNARGTFMMCREAARCIEAGGRIVNISSGITVANSEGMALYAGSKAALEAFSKVLARELAPRGVTVNIVSPGMTDTPMLEGGDAAMLRKVGASLAAMKRLGQPEDVADGVAALVSPDGRWITGQNIHVDGGTIIV